MVIKFCGLNITKRGSFLITNRGKNLLQIETAFLLHIGPDLLQIGASL